MKNKKIFYFLPVALLSFVFTAQAYVASSTNFRIESDVVSMGGGFSTSTNFSVQDSLSDRVLGMVSGTTSGINTGYLPMLSSSISVTYPSSVALLPAIKSGEGGQGNGSASVTVITDNPGGYSLSVKASTEPALKSNTDSFANYNPALLGTPDFNWSVVLADSRFGFSPEGIHIHQKYKDDGISCNAGIGDTINKCWDSIDTVNKVISISNLNNHPLGTATTLKLRSEAGSGRRQGSGTYVANIIITAIAL